MKITEIGIKATKELLEVISGVKESQILSLKELILKTNKIYFSGAGRSLLMMRCLAMRLMHVGFNIYIVGDTTTPVFEKDDLLIVASGSGETKSSLLVVDMAKSYGGSIASFTRSVESTIALRSDVVVEIPPYISKENEDNILPAGSIFEQSILILGDSMILDLAKAKNIPVNKMFDLHTNLE